MIIRDGICYPDVPAGFVSIGLAESSHKARDDISGYH